MPLEQSIIQQIRNNSITTLSLQGKQIGDAEAKELAEALKDNHSITTIYLYANQIGDAGAQAIAEALKTNHNIIYLDIGHNKMIGDAGVQALAEALKVNYTITTFYLYNNNQIGDAGAQAMAEALKVNKAITNFCIDRNSIGPVGVRYLADALKINKSIVTFYTNFNNLGDIVKKEIETALQINKDFPAEAKKEALAKQIAEQARQKEAERLAKEAKIREQEEAEAAKEAARLKAIEEARQQEAERLEQETKLREQEEVKAAKEAARLKAIEEAKVKEYIPNIPAVKLFEVAGEDNQFNDDDQATIQQVSDLIREGNDRLQEHGKQGILLLGNTGAGKSTLAHLFSGRKLQAIMDDETAELVIEAMQPLGNIVIGHKMTSETKIPNKCLTKDLIIWDCPGFNDTDPVQEIANSFYIKRLFETTDQLKFVLVVDESNLSSNKGSIFLETLSNFIKSFRLCPKNCVNFKIGYI